MNSERRATIERELRRMTAILEVFSKGLKDVENRWSRLESEWPEWRKEVESEIQEVRRERPKAPVDKIEKAVYLATGWHYVKARRAGLLLETISRYYPESLDELCRKAGAVTRRRPKTLYEGIEDAGKIFDRGVMDNIIERVEQMLKDLKPQP